MNKRSILEKLVFFKTASPALQSEVLAAGVERKLAPATVLYRQGDRCDHVALVGWGSVRVFKADSSGNEITLYHVQDGQPCLVSMLSLFLGRPAMASAVVEVSTDAVMIPAGQFRRWIESEPLVRSFVFEVMGQRLIDVMVLVEELAFHKTDHRLARLILERFSHQGRPLRIIETTHDELARELGTAREVVSRLLKGLERRGAIAIARGHIALLDERILNRLVASHNCLHSEKNAVCVTTVTD